MHAWPCFSLPFYFLYPLLFSITLPPPFFLHIFIFIFISWYWQVNAILWNRRGVMVLGVTNGAFNIVAINPFFCALGWEKFVDFVK